MLPRAGFVRAVGVCYSEGTPSAWPLTAVCLLAFLLPSFILFVVPGRGPISPTLGNHYITGLRSLFF